MRKTVVILLWVVIGGAGLLSIGGACVVILIGLGIGASESYGNPPEFVFWADPTPRWSPDGSSIVFGHGDGRIYVASSDGTRLHSISVTSGEYDIDVSPSVSPDGTRIAYATLRHETGFLWNRSREFEIVMSSLDGSGKRRLTKNQVRDRFPTWSPDGARIAFTSSSSSLPVSRVISTVNLDGSGARQVVSLRGVTPGVIISPPVWSPDGSHIAFVANHQSTSKYAVYVSGIDGSDLTLVRETSRILYKPSWSPDGGRIVFAEFDEHEFDEERSRTRLYTADHDGSNLHELPMYLRKIYNDSDLYTPDTYLDTLSWSPDGSEILIESSVVSLDAYSLLVLPGPGGIASWSPDGSRIAITARSAIPGVVPRRAAYSYFDVLPPAPEVVLYMVGRDGSDARVLVKQDDRGNLLAANGRPLDNGQPVTTIYFDESGRWISAPYDIAQCSNGFVVPNPDDNPGLVRDCKTLLRIRDSFGADRPLNWSTDIPISEWEGIQQFSDPSGVRGVRSIRLTGRYLSGEISSEFGNLTSLWELHLSNNRLEGEIPAELGNLTNLDELRLSNNRLEGEIPAELGNLTNLRQLHLSNNGLEGEIPAEIGNLTSLHELHLSDNELEGEIPAEIGNLVSLRGLYLSNNGLEGEIPAEIGNLVSLRGLSFDHDRLTGMLEVLSVLDLGSLWLEGSRCIPKRVFEMVGVVYHDDHVGPCED